MLFNYNLKYFFVFTLLFCSTLLAQSNFEGKVIMRITGDESTDMNYFAKGDKIRMEVEAEGNEAIILFNLKESKIYFVMPEQQMYMEMPGIDYSQFSEPDEADDEPDITRTGETKLINGYKCEKWIYNENGNVVEAWMTDQLGGFFMMQNPMDKNANSWQQKLQGFNFPMKVTVFENGKQESSMEVISVEEGSLNDNLFSIPTGFQKLSIPGMDMQKQQ